MSNTDTAQQRFYELLTRVVDGQHTPDELDELLNLANSNSEFKQQLKTELEMDFLLSQVDNSEEKSTEFVDQVLTNSKSIASNSEFENKVLGAIGTQALEAKTWISRLKQNLFSKQSFYFSWGITGLSLMSCVLFAVLIFRNSVAFNPVDDEILDNGVAVIVNVVDNSQRFYVGQLVSPGELHVDDGFMELEFYHGAQLKIAGPAHLSIIDEAKVELHRGKVMTDVPEVAIGFTVDTPNSKVVDLGTAIGVSVDENGSSQVHVFEGLVETVAETGEKYQIGEGEAVSQDSKEMSQWYYENAQTFLFEEFSEIADLSVYEVSKQQKKWLEIKEWVLQDPDLLAYYDFEKNDNKPRLLTNLSQNEAVSSGAIIGAQWQQGPWPGKSALEFKRPSDRVRVNIPGEMDQFTLATWIKIDSLDRLFNSILLTDGWEVGDIHWQLGSFAADNQAGTIILGLKHKEKDGRNYNYKPFFSPSESGVWYHIATTLDNNTREVKIYVNGEKMVTRKLKFLAESWHFNKALIGNWDNKKQKSPLRNLNGAMAELAVFSRALNEEEVKKLSLN